MTEDEAYKVHIQYTFNAFCKVVIRHGSILKSPQKPVKSMVSRSGKALTTPLLHHF